MKTLARMLALIAIPLFVAGCVGLTKKEAEFSPAFSPSVDIRFEVGQVTNATGTTFNFDITEELRKQLLLQLQQSHLDWHEASAINHLVLNTEILDYAKGDAYDRWNVYSGRSGRTLLEVQCVITESGNGSQIGTVKVLRTIDIGGLFTIGQWKVVFRTVATDVVNEIKIKLQAKPTKTTTTL